MYVVKCKSIFEGMHWSKRLSIFRVGVLIKNATHAQIGWQMKSMTKHSGPLVFFFFFRRGEGRVKMKGENA